MKRKLFLLSFFLILSLACSSALITDLATKSGDVQFRDDFSDTSSGWIRSTTDADYQLDDGSIVDYANGTYRIFVNQAGYDYWSVPALAFNDVRIEVDAMLIDGSEVNRIGLVCRYQDEKNFYFFIISSDGYYAIGKVKADELSLLGQEQMQLTRVVNAGNTPNHLRADCIGNTLTFYANNQPLGIVDDSDFTSGDVGILAGAFKESGVDVRFDNFVVYKP